MITDPSEPFSIKSIDVNQFLYLGSHKGKCQLLFITANEKNAVTLDTESVMQLNAYCNHYPVINCAGFVIGSLFIIFEGHYKLETTHLIVGNPAKERGSDFSGIQVEGVGGVFTFKSENDYLLIVPASPNVTELNVVD